MICMYIPVALAKLYYCQGWTLTHIAHHGKYSLLACRDET